MYAKLFASLYQGTLRGQSAEILVFTNLIAHCDKEGYVDKHFRAIADETGLDLEDVKAAIEHLEAPDPDSRSPEEDGRRIVRIDDHRAWGWQVVNYLKYRQIQDEEARRETWRKSQQKRRSGQHRSTPVNIGQHRSTHTEGEGDTNESAARSLGAPAREVLPLDAIQAKVNSLRPEWQKMPHWTYAEQSDLLGAAAALESLDAESWRILADYLRARLPQGCPGWQPRSRRKFIEAPGDVLNYALEWHRKQRRPATRPAPEPETPLTPEQRAELLAELKSKP